MLSERQILELRGPKRELDPWRPFGVSHDREPGPHGPIMASTVFLVGKECPFRCLMCDLWQYTLDAPTPAGAISQQLRIALEQIPHRQCIKLYNASNFFDPKAVPDQDLVEVTSLLREFDSVVVENHPKLLGPRLFDFAHRLEGRLQVAMGLESANPEVLKRLNKKMKVADFRSACDQLTKNKIGVRAFVIYQLPGVPPEDATEDICRSVRFAIDCGVNIISLIPLRAGNGAIDSLRDQDKIELPRFAEFLTTAYQGLKLALEANRIFLVDLWDPPSNACTHCSTDNIAAWQWANESQFFPIVDRCTKCGDSTFSIPDGTDRK